MYRVYIWWSLHPPYLNTMTYLIQISFIILAYTLVRLFIQTITWEKERKQTFVVGRRVRARSWEALDFCVSAANWKYKYNIQQRRKQDPFISIQNP